MTPAAAAASKLFAVGTLVGDAAVVLLLIALAVGGPAFRPLLRLVSERALGLSFLIAAASTGGSLVYSQLAGFEPCELCWVQRIFMFPLPVIFGIGLIRKDRAALDYGLALAVLGAAVAAYHHYIQLGGSPLIPCSAEAGGSPCAKRLVWEFGYITLPMMSLTAFALIGLVAAVSRLHPARRA